MLESSLEFFRCVRCGSKLDLDIFVKNNEIKEGLLECSNCCLIFPIIENIPILWDDLAGYFSVRRVLGGKLFNLVTSSKMKSILKSTLSENTPNKKYADVTAIEERWSLIYQNSKNSEFYSLIKDNLDSMPNSKLALEYGCSIGIMDSRLSDLCELVFGIDKSFDALLYAKKSYTKANLDYVVADFMSPIFGSKQFDLILALNVLELIEPLEFLESISKQITRGYLVLSDPYDFDRGANSVKNPVNELTLRSELTKLGFRISPGSEKSSFLPWNLNLNPRATLNYKVDLIIAKK